MILHGYLSNSLLTVLRIEQTADNLEKVVKHSIMTVPPLLIGGMTAWMDSFIEMFDFLLNMIHFQRTGNFEGFLETVHQFLPWCFGLNCHNYDRNMSYYYVDMRDLKNGNPDAYQFLCDGGFTGFITGERHAKPMDQIIEMTANRFSKETGGLSVNTQNVCVSQRWMRINHYLAALKQHLVERTNGTKAKHVEPGSKRMQQDGDAVVRTLAGLQAWVPNMWSPNQPLVNIATGVKAPAEMTQNVSTTKERGEQLVKPARTHFKDNQECQRVLKQQELKNKA